MSCRSLVGGLTDGGTYCVYIHRDGLGQAAVYAHEELDLPFVEIVAAALGSAGQEAPREPHAASVEHITAGSDAETKSDGRQIIRISSFGAVRLATLLLKAAEALGAMALDDDEFQP
ncbi:MAG: hypothetical protein ACLQIK_08375 [Mycobacterium sp.]|uniref:hypothetical protein n=1 Tax=Mycobacterium sp. TaxID=1785 RepID=UPI003F97FD9F